MKSKANADALSHTRGVPLEDLTGLCSILDRKGGRLSVMNLANAGIEQDVIYKRGAAVPSPVARGARLPTRINHRMISLRELGLVESHPAGGHIFYELTTMGRQLASAVADDYEGCGQVYANATLRSVWRTVLVASPYVRNQWLKYFMETKDFGLHDLIKTDKLVTIFHAPSDERNGSRESQGGDSGYRIRSTHWPEKRLNDVERREIHQGLRLWTDASYLTDYRLPVDLEIPFLYQTDVGTSDGLRLEYYVARAWLDPESDVERFGEDIRLLLTTWGVSRTTIPSLIIEMARRGGYAKRNIREMLVALYYGTNQYFFERGSEFLIRRAFEDVKSEDFYVQIEGVWRTGLMLR